MSKLPYYKQQTPFTCSLACLRMVLDSIGRKFSEVELAKIVGFSTKRGFSPRMMDRLCDIIGVKYEYHFDSTLEELNTMIKEGFHPIVLVKPNLLYGITETEHGHYIIVKDITKENIIFNDPDQEYGGENKSIEREKFLGSWKHNFVFIIKGEDK